MSDKKKDAGTDEPKSKKDKAPQINVTAKKDGFRRCGVAHSAQGTKHDLDDFTPEQWQTLIGEPQLVVSSGTEGFAEYLADRIKVASEKK